LPLFLAATEQYGGRQYETCVGNYRKVLELIPDDVNALNNLAFALAENLGRAAEGLPYAEKAVQLQPAQPAFLDTKGWCQARAGKYEDAKRTLTEAISRQPDFLEARYHLGMAYKMEGRDASLTRQFLQVARDMAA